MTGVDLAVAASRPRGIADALAVNLAMQTTRNDSLAARIVDLEMQKASLAATVRRLTEERDGLLTANESLWEERCRFRREALWLRAELGESRS